MLESRTRTKIKTSSPKKRSKAIPSKFSESRYRLRATTPLVRIQNNLKEMQDYKKKVVYCESIVPSWLSRRKDFIQCWGESLKLQDQTVPEILSRSSQTWRNTEYHILESWFSEIPFFSELPSFVRKDMYPKIRIGKWKKNQEVHPDQKSFSNLMVILEGEVSLNKENRKIATLREKNILGDTELLNNLNSNVSINSESTLLLGLIRRKDYESTLAKYRESVCNERVNFLKTLPVFQDWKNKNLKKAGFLVFEMLYEPGEPVYEIGNYPHFLYVVKEGEIDHEVRVSMKKSNYLPTRNSESLNIEEQYKHSLGVSSSGGLFGVRELLENLNRETLAKAKTNSVVYAIPFCLVLKLFSKEDLNKLKELDFTVSKRKTIHKEVRGHLKFLNQKFKNLMSFTGTKELPCGRKVFARIPTKREKYIEQIFRENQSQYQEMLVHRNFNYKPMSKASSKIIKLSHIN